MCGRYGFSVKNIREVYQRFHIENELEGYKPRYNIAPGEMNPVITKHSPNTISYMFWGLVPFWAKEKTRGLRTINARAEGIETKASFRQPLRVHRCLIPVTGFYEPDKSVDPSVWYYFHLKDEDVFAFAGLYDIWKDPATQQDLYSYTIITCAANALIGQIHDRMPVILYRDDEERWLNPEITEPGEVLALLKPFPAEDMLCYQVSNAAKNPRNEGPDLIKPVESMPAPHSILPPQTAPSRSRLRS
jgi:putative SOS response-associated peptidase YedK